MFSHQDDVGSEEIKGALGRLDVLPRNPHKVFPVQKMERY
jgi:hypothetical protein